MKTYFHIILAFVLLLGLSSQTNAQKVAYVDSEYILGQMSEYKAAQEELDRVSAQWQKEIETKYGEIEKLKTAYQAEQIILTDEMKKKREQEISQREQEVKELQKEKFGVGGELFRKRQELIKPIQDKVYAAIKSVAEKKSYAIIFDKSSDLTLLYTNSKYDISDDVLDLINTGGKK